MRLPDGNVDDPNPYVISTFPANGARGVPLSANIAANLSMPMKAQTITNATAIFTLKRGTTPVAGTVIYAGTTATFNPSSNLAANTKYTATITDGATGSGGLASGQYDHAGASPPARLQDTSRSRTPRDFHIPGRMASEYDVPVTANIAVNFNKAMNPQNDHHRQLYFKAGDHARCRRHGDLCRRDGDL